LQPLRVAGELLPVRFSSKRGRLTYRLRVPVQGLDERFAVRVRLLTHRLPWRVEVFADDAPVCTRHRFRDGALCMWWERHPISRRWVLSDGLPALVHYVQIHLFQEACCRAGLPWPGEQAPGEHPRKRSCPSCQGEGP
jgi:hypothetical protein